MQKSSENFATFGQASLQLDADCSVPMAEKVGVNLHWKLKHFGDYQTKTYRLSYSRKWVLVSNKKSAPPMTRHR
jgi:hypothetical protein